jgi:deoxyribodipyrimidine photo-lyase
MKTSGGGAFKVFSAEWRAAAPKAGDVGPKPAPESTSAPAYRSRSGANAAPWFGIFNAVLPGERFDSQASHICKRAQELAQLGNDYIHKPWTADATALTRAGVRLGATYPRPIVEHAAARNRRLATYERLP